MIYMEICDDLGPQEKNINALKNRVLSQEKKNKALQSHLLQVKARWLAKVLTFCLPHNLLHKRNEVLTGTGEKNLIKAEEEIVRKEIQKASSLIKDLQNQLEKKENEKASLIKAIKANKEMGIIKFLGNLCNQLEQKEDEHNSVVKAKEENEKALLGQDLQTQLQQKENENASLIEQLARSEKELVQKANEHAALVRDFEQQVAQQVNDMFTQRIQSQPQVDGETWQFQGDSSEWVSFPASLTVISTFGICFFPAVCGRE